MRLRVKDKLPRLYDHKLNLVSFTQDEGYWDVTLPLFGLYKLQRGMHRAPEFIEYTSKGVCITDANGTAVNFTSHHDGFEMIYVIES